MLNPDSVPAIDDLLHFVEEQAASERYVHGRYGPFQTARALLEQINRDDDAQLMQWAGEAFAFHAKEAGASGSHFGPMMTIGDSEAPVWTDMPVEKLDFYRQRATTARNPIVRARYSDIVWEKRRDHECGRRAVIDYLDSTQIYLERFQAPLATRATTRAVEIAVQLNDAKLRADTIRLALQHAHRAAEGQDYMLSLELLRLLLGMSKRLVAGALKDLAELALEAAAYHKAIGGESLWTQREFLFVARDVARKFDDELAATLLTRQIAESYEQHAAAREPLVASSLYTDALNEYRRLGETEKVADLLLKIRDANRKAESEFGVIESSLTVPSQEIEDVIAGFTARPVEEALQLLSRSFVPSVDRMLQTTLELKQQSPLQFMIGHSVMSSDARVVGKSSGEDELIQRHVVFQTRLSYQSWASIIGEILRRLAPLGLDASSLADYLSTKDLLIECRRAILETGLARYMEGDYISSIHVLVPEIEHILRSVLPRIGTPDTFVDEKGLMRVLPLERVLRSPALSSGLGKDVSMYLYTFLADQDAENVRNDVAHGLISPERCNEVIATTVVHILLVLSAFKIGPADQESEP